MKHFVCALRHFEEPQDVTNVAELNYVSLDKKHVLSVYEGQDVDVVRPMPGESIGRIFVANMWRELLGLGPSAPVGRRSIVLVERYYDPTPIEELLERAKRDWAPCFNANRIDLVDSFMPTKDYEVGGVCVYATPDAETLRRANRNVGLELERAWTARVLEPV